MQKFLAFCLGLMLVLGCGSNSHYVRTPLEMSRINDSVVALVTPQTTSIGYHRVYCTGTFISRSTVLTAQHCVDGDATVLIATHRDWAQAGYTAQEDIHLHEFRVAHVNKDWDLALLEVMNEQALPPHQVLRVSRVAPRQAERIVVMGHPRGLGWTMTTGVVSSEERHGWHDQPEEERQLFIQHEANASPGNSGGPLINHRNEIVGVVVQTWNHENHLSMSVHTSILNKFLARHR